MKNIDKKPNTENKEETEKDLLRKKKEQELKQMLLNLTEDERPDKFSDKNLDRHNQKIELLGGKVITINGVLSSVRATKREYSVQFPEEFYDQLYRLSGKVKLQKKNQKPYVFAPMTVQSVYLRYNEEVFDALQTLNPYIGNKRGSYYHLYLTADGLVKLQTHIQDAVELMKQSKNWYEFRVRLFRKYGVPFDIDAFENLDDIK